jgi:hypothetical protein
MNHYWKYHYEFIEDDQLMVELPIFAFSFGQVQEFLTEAKDKWKLLGGKPSVCKVSAKKMQRRASVKTRVPSKRSQLMQRIRRLTAFSRT